MTSRHPVTPTFQQIDNWFTLPLSEEERLAAAFAAGADMELEACIEWLGDAPVVYNDNNDLHPGSYLRDARRPKPPSLKRKAMALLDMAEDPSWDINDFSIVRQALEALPE
jgi:hypothetical protein